MSNEYKRYIGIDFGTKRIGIALTDPLLTFAYPYKTLNNDEKFWNTLTQIITEMDVTKIILGYPLTDRGNRQEITNKVDEFKSELEKRFQLEIILWDERFSSSMAKDNMLQTITKKSKRKDKGILDMNAAAILLKEYLESL